MKRDNPTLRQEQLQAGKPQGMLMERWVREVGRSECLRESRRIEHETWLNAKTSELQPRQMSVQISNRCLIVREPAESSKMRKQMMAIQAGALKDDAVKWNSINWTEAQQQVRRLLVPRNIVFFV